MRYFIDSEFVDDGKTIDLISIALVAEDGREYYAQSAEFLQHGKPTPWIQENVIPHLDNEWKERATIRDEICAFVGDGKVEFWGYYSAYDHVALCQLFGPMVDIPSNWPYFIRDIQQEFARFGIPERPLPKQEGATHNALSDARYIKRLWEWLQGGQA